ncbi:hypothetical protein HDU76_009814 [Blyttiomyces sp. JEL0837]|nr:hypothetical protein HDU76_009814 [Blyttiomyces sp. JEL0837]
MNAKISFAGRLRSILFQEASWNAFESKIRKIHSIPDNVAISVTYTDPDGDEIAIDTDDELNDILLQVQSPASPFKSLRFNVTAKEVAGGDSGAFVFVPATGRPSTSVTNPVAERVNTQQQQQEVDAASDSSFTTEPLVVPNDTVPEHATINQTEDQRYVVGAAQQETPAQPTNEPTSTSTSTAVPIPPVESSSSSASTSSSSSSREKGKEKAVPQDQQQSGSSSSAPGADAGAGPSSDGKSKFESFYENIQPLISELNDEFEKSNLGPLLEKIALEAQTNFEPMFEELFENIHKQTQNAGGPFPGAPFGAFGPGVFPGGCFPGANTFPGCNPTAGRPAGCGPKRRGSCHGRRGFHPFYRNATDNTTATGTSTPRWFGIVCDGCNARSFTGQRFTCTTCPDFDLCGSCHEKASEIHNSQHEFDKRKHPVEIEEDRAVEMVKEMGFFDEEKVRDLLRRYEGNLSRVLDVLMAEEKY